MLALKEFANFVTLNMANLAATFSRLLAEQSQNYAAISPDSRTATGRKLLNAVVEACQEQASDPLVSLFKENTQQTARRWPANITPSNPLTEVECLGQTLTPVVTNLEAGKFLWQTLREIRADLLNNSPLPSKAVIVRAEESAIFDSSLSNQNQEIGLFGALIDNLPDIIFMKDAEGHFLLANDALRRQLGAVTVADVVGKTDYDFNPPELAEQYRADDRKLMESGESLIGVEEPIYDHETGVTGWVSTTKIPFRDEQGNIAGIMGVVRDITELKTAQLTLSTRIRELDCLNELGRQIEEAPVPSELLQWTTERLPAAMQHPDLCEVAITFDDVVYGVEEAIKIPSQMTHGLYIGGQVQGRVYVAYTQKQDFLNEESALLGAVATRISVFLENQKLFNDMQIALAQARTLANEQTVLTELGQALTTRLNVEQLLEETYRQASRLVDSTNFYIGLYDKDKHQIAFPFDVTESEIDKALTIISADEGLAGYIVKNRTPLLFKDNVTADTEALGIAVVGQKTESWLGVPLMIGDEVLGVMAVQSYTTPRLYNEHSQDLLMAIGSQVAIALQNAYLFKETETVLAETRLMAQQQVVLNEFGQALTARLSVEGVIEEVYREATRLIDTTNFYIGLYNEEAHQISFPLMVSQSEIDREIMTISADQGLAGYIVRNRTGVLLEENVKKQQEALGVKMVGQEPQSWLGVPMIVGDTVLGVIAVQNYTTPGLFTQRDHELLTAVANQAAVAIQNARQFEETQIALVEVEQSQKMLRAIIDATPDWIFIKDREHRYQLVNQAYANAFKMTPAQFIGKNDLEIGFPEDIVKGNPEKGIVGFWPDDDEVMASGQMKIIDVEPAVVDDKQIYLSTVKVPLHDADGNVTAVMGFVKDITDREQLLVETEELYKVSTALNAAQSYNDLLDVVRQYTIANRAPSVSLGYFSTPVSVGDDLPNSFDILASWRPEIEEAFRVHYTLDEFPSFVHLARSELTVFEDISQETFLDENLRAVFNAANAKTIVYAPVVAAGRWVGFLSLIYQQKETFSQAELQRVTAVTAQLSSALQNLYNFNKAQTSQREAQILQQLAQTLTGSLQIKEVINAFFNATQQLLGVDFSVFSLVDAQKQRVLAIDGYNVSDNHIQLANHPLDSDDIMADIIRTGQTELIRGTDDPRFNRETVEAEGMETWGLRIFTPITVRQENIGLIEVGFKENVDVAVEETQVQLLKTLTDQVAISLENAQRYQASQQAARREQTIREITDKMRSATNMDELVKIAAEELGQQLSAGHTVVKLGVTTLLSNPTREGNGHG